MDHTLVGGFELFTVEDLADWMLGYCVHERRCEPGQVAVLEWLTKPLSELQAQSNADMALLYAARDYALEQGWIEDGPRVGMFRITKSGYERAASKA